ncbi:MAG: HAMP domain-containing histidine kinase [Burkholderiaceae bacterium]|nr:HAMP domain-containing histidine kinase [Burkholderiaceae bacterium]
MELFVLDEVVVEWEARLADMPPDAPALDLLLSLSWHLRQRDARRALQLAAQARARLRPGQAGWLRLDLVEAEIALLSGEFDKAQAQILRALQGLEVISEPQGLADAHVLQAWVHQQAGRSLEAIASLNLAAACAREGADVVRARVAELSAALVQTFRDPVAGRTRGAPDEVETAAMPEGLAMWAHELQGTLAAQASDYGRAAAMRMLAFEEALQTGQLLRALVAALNAAAALNSLNEYDMALQWLDHALSLARRTGWPVYLANGLALMGETQRNLGRLEAARESLQESLAILTPLPRGRGYAVLLKYIGDLDLDQHQPQAALARFIELQQRAQIDAQADMAVYACRGQAQALARLGRPEEAAKLADQALQLAQGSQNVYRQIDALRALAGLHARHRLPPPEGMAATSASLHFLQQALALAEGMKGYLVPGELWEELAEEHARTGDLQQAYALLRRAAPAYRKIQSDAANKRLLAMQTIQQTERARAEAQAQRRVLAQRQQEERLAAMGRLVAGVAHELNTPLGNCLMVASTLQSGSERVARELQEQTLRRSEMQQFLKDAQQASELLMGSLTRAAELVQRFRQIAVDRSSEVLQSFDLRPLCERCLADCQAQSDALGVRLLLDVPAGLELHSYPSALQQVLNQLLNNALQHAFASRSAGWLRLRASLLADDKLRLEVCDDGQGIAAEHQGKIFDPFFSTRFGQGSSGLGLHICHNLVTAVLGGHIQVHSSPGQGCCFELTLPIRAQAPTRS